MENTLPEGQTCFPGKTREFCSEPAVGIAADLLLLPLLLGFVFVCHQVGGALLITVGVLN